MKNLWKFILIASLMTGVTQAQTTAVSATVTDSDSIAWANGSITFQLVNPNPQIAPSYNGTPLTASQQSFTVALNGSGSLVSQPVYSNSTLTPALTLWRITVCSNTTAPCQSITPQQINGTTLDLSSIINGQIQAIRLAASPSTRAYADLEINPTPPAGGTYYNVTNSVTRVWSGTAWSNQGGGGGSGNSVTLETIASAPGDLTFTHNLSSIFYTYSCFTRSGVTYSAATCSSYPVDSNNAIVTVPSAGDYIVTFNSVNPIPADFSVAASPTSLLYEPTMSGTQQPTFTINQTATGGYTGTANYTASSFPSGMSGVCSPSSITGTGSCTLTLSFPFSQTPATSSFNVQGTDGTKTHSTSPSITVGNINTGLVDCWPMTDGSGSSFANSCGTGNTETLATGTLTWASNAGLPGTTATFSATAVANGTNQTATNFDGTTPFSITTWVKLSGSASYRVVASTFDTSTNRGWEFAAANAGSNFSPSLFLINTLGTNELQVTSNSTFTAGGLHYIAVTYDGSRTAAGVKLYIDGVVGTNGGITANLTATIANTTKVSLGGRPAGNLNINGIQAYTRIYNRVLSATDIANYFAAGAR